MDKSNVMEYIENIYGLASNYLKNNSSLKLKELLEHIEKLEDNIIECDDDIKYNEYKIQLYKICSEIEAIIDE